jgi:hypothetical protein
MLSVLSETERLNFFLMKAVKGEILRAYEQGDQILVEGEDFKTLLSQDETIKRLMTQKTSHPYY